MAEKPVNIQSMVTSRDRLPAVMLRLGDEYINMPPDQARKIGMWLIEAAESAEQDAFLVNYLTKEAGFALEKAGAVLRLLREAREKAEEEDGS